VEKKKKKKIRYRHAGECSLRTPADRTRVGTSPRATCDSNVVDVYVRYLRRQWVEPAVRIATRSGPYGAPVPAGGRSAQMRLSHAGDAWWRPSSPRSCLAGTGVFRLPALQSGLRQSMARGPARRRGRRSELVVPRGRGRSRRSRPNERVFAAAAWRPTGPSCRLLEARSRAPPPLWCSAGNRAAALVERELGCASRTRACRRGCSRSGSRRTATCWSSATSLDDQRAAAGGPWRCAHAESGGPLALLLTWSGVTWLLVGGRSARSSRCGRRPAADLGERARPPAPGAEHRGRARAPGRRP
jgi:hypothetical protein